ncbi:GntR family transcriptional regulator [Streptomyces fuscichromogenes]|uniref:GntR family transcriptional regulator n=1 Tax=Streptomyces fuscichromogenes TaxID=1324013 RepID=A0A918CTQ3_9ACTN|nr:GntR family transcriptional regulator [Streptomyces fuscichromogenes]GGN22817.1 GntR family transcriptional regulator [Streptomyces fuscichromogenes]
MASRTTDEKRLSKSESAYRVLKERIVGGVYASGHRLVLDQLAKEFGVSAVPVREAVRRLEAQGYVRFERNVGAEVIGIDPSEYAHVMQTLAYLEGAATSLAAPLLTPDDLARARQLNEELRGCLEDFDPVGFTRTNQRFHRLLCGRCPNPHLRELVERDAERMSMIRSSTFVFVPLRARESVTEHHQLLDLLETGAPALEIEVAARDHKLGTLRAFLESGAGRPSRLSH